MCHDDILLFALHLCFLLRQSLIGEAESLGRRQAHGVGRLPWWKDMRCSCLGWGAVRVT